MNIVVIDSCVLINTSLFWDCGTKNKKIIITQRKFRECEALFDLIKKNNGKIVCVITKTIENEASSALKKAVKSLLKKKKWKLKDQIKKYSYSILKNTLCDRSLDRMESLVEEYSTRLPLDKQKVNKIIENEIEPFFEKHMPKTVRYIPLPHAVKKIKGSIEGKRRILENMIDDISTDKMMYIKGEPKEKDKRIIGEAVHIKRNENKERVFLASLDYHFIPNPTQIESYKSALYTKYYKNMCSGMRDAMFNNFGFFADRPKELLDIFENEMGLSIN